MRVWGIPMPRGRCQTCGSLEPGWAAWTGLGAGDRCTSWPEGSKHGWPGINTTAYTAGSGSRTADVRGGGAGSNALQEKGGRWQMGFKRGNTHIPDLGRWFKEKESVLQQRGELRRWAQQARGWRVRISAETREIPVRTSRSSARGVPGAFGTWRVPTGRGEMPPVSTDAAGGPGRARPVPGLR